MIKHLPAQGVFLFIFNNEFLINCQPSPTSSCLITSMQSEIKHFLSSTDKRINRLDVIKGIIAICVVIGHAKKMPQSIITLIFSFHVPCFFILSGYISSLKNSNLKFINFFTKKTKRILIPYLFFFVVGYVYWLLTCQIEIKRLVWLSRPWWDPLIGLIDNSGPSLYVSPGLWFLPCLFLTQMCFFSLNIFFNKKIITCLFILLTLYTILKPSYFTKTLPFSLHLFILSNFFYSIGHVSHSIKYFYNKKIDSFFVIIFLIPLWFFLSKINGQVDLNNARYGNFYGLSIINALIGSLLVCLSSRYLNFTILAKVGKTTLCILGFNFQLLSIISFIIYKFNISSDLTTSIISSISIISLCLLLFQLLKKVTPKLIGEIV